MGNAALRARQFMLADAPPKLVAIATTLALNGMGARLCILAVQTDTVLGINRPFRVYMRASAILRCIRVSRQVHDSVFPG